MTSTL
jgi:hypothetical protein